MEKCHKQPSMQARVKAHGTISISMIFTSFALALFILIKYSVIISLVYILAICIFLILVSGIYCSKCQARDKCNHLFIGALSKILSRYKNESYTARDIIIGIVLPSIVVIGIPQYWLFKNIYFFIVYWILLAVAALEVNLYVCRNCANRKCPMCKAK